MSVPYTLSYFKPSILPEQIIELHGALVNAGSGPAAKQAALAIIKEYYNFFSTSALRHDMWTMLSGALGNSEIVTLQEPVQRHNLLFFL